MKNIIQKITSTILASTLALMVFGFMAPTAQAAHYSQFSSAQKDQIIDLLREVIVFQAMNTSDADAMSDAANLRVQLNKQLQSHVSLSLAALRNLHDENDQVDASLAELDENTDDLGASVGSVFGDDAQEAFEDLWRDHIGFFADETIGLRENDDEMVEEAREDLEGYAEDIAAVFVSLMPSLDEETLMAGANEHRSLVSGSMEAYADEDYADAYQLQYEGEMQVKGLADALTAGITNRFPNQF